ncbi:MAG: hypothetical protein LBD53_01260 [Tannerella sp.]|jgi:hypothetical protein|nr:hypothetical protein [Tannerella sp.]
MKYFFNRLYRLLFCRGGFGVHSPFVFDLITNVIEETTPFYCYDLLRAKRSQLKHDGRKLLLKEHDCRLLMRLANRFHASRILAYADHSGEVSLYTTAHSSTAQCDVSQNPDKGACYDILYIDFKSFNVNTFESLLRHVDKNSLLIIDGIKSSPDHKLAWQKVCRHPLPTVKIDLYTLGLVFFDTQLPNLTRKGVVL